MVPNFLGHPVNTDTDSFIVETDKAFICFDNKTISVSVYNYIGLQWTVLAYSINLLQFLCHTYHLHREPATKKVVKSELKKLHKNGQIVSHAFVMQATADIS